MKRALLILGALLAAAMPGSQQAAPLISDDMLAHLKTRYSSQAHDRGLAVNRLLERLDGGDTRTQLAEVNRFFNRFQYREDHDHWGQQDYWATPTEFIGTHQGDCEDFVIAKYFALRSIGVPDERLYLTYVKALRQNVAHMVLSYFETPTSVPLILDNYNPEILPATARRDLLPVYSFNAKSLFLTNASAGLGRSLPTDKIKNSKWRKLLDDLRKEQP